MQNSHFDIAIIGGGVIGLSLARGLAAAGPSLCLIDANGVTPPASLAAAGMLAPSFEPAEKTLTQFSLASLGQWRDHARGLEDETGIDIDYRADGILGIAMSEEEAEEMALRVAALRGEGRPVELLDRAGVHTLEPGLSDRIIAGMLAPQEAQIDARKLHKALGRAVTNAGVTTIKGFVRAVSGSVGARKIEMDGAEPISAGIVVIASGAMAAIAIDGAKMPPLVPVKGEALALAGSDTVLNRVVRAKSVYLCPKSDGRIIVGASEKPGETSRSVDAGEIHSLRGFAEMTTPRLRQWGEVERWSGIRPGTADKAPILGAYQSGPEDIFFALGHYRNGILLSPATTQLLCAMILGDKKTDDEMKAFSPDRFSSH